MNTTTLADRQAAFDDARAEIYAKIGQLADFLRENPNAHPDLRKQKLRAWRLLEDELKVLAQQIERVWEQWLKERGSKPVHISAALAEVLDAMAAKRRSKEAR